MSLLQVSNFLVNIYIYIYATDASPRGVFTPKNAGTHSDTAMNTGVADYNDVGQHFNQSRSN